MAFIYCAAEMFCLFLNLSLNLNLVVLKKRAEVHGPILKKRAEVHGPIIPESSRWVIRISGGLRRKI